jgi:hypothetical protein
VDDLVAKAVAEAAHHDREFAAIALVPAQHRRIARVVLVRQRLDVGQRVGRGIALHHQPQPTLVKNTAKKASSTITAKIAETTDIVVLRPTSSEFPLTCMP